jgi:hypothetical protein
VLRNNRALVCEFTSYIRIVHKIRERPALPYEEDDRMRSLVFFLALGCACTTAAAASAQGGCALDPAPAISAKPQLAKGMHAGLLPDQPLHEGEPQKLA